MSNAELIAELTDICIRQAEMLKAYAFLLEQLDAEAAEEERLNELNRLRALVGPWKEDVP